MKCEKCIYFDDDVCKRYPPAISAAMDSSDELIPFLGYPSVEPDDWCGEFKAEAKH
jgi:hypothetical protein